MLLRCAAILIALVFAWPTARAEAQSLGTHQWQLQPYCNVITVHVTQQGLIYVLDGTDDRCGGGNQQASAVGVAYLTPFGLVGIGLTSVLPNGTPLHTEVTLNLATLNGTWRDSAGNSGDFIYTAGPAASGAPRPVRTLRAEGGNLTFPLTGTPAVVRTVQVPAPVGGQILVNASGTVQFTGAASVDLVRCSVTTGTGLDADALTIAQEGSAVENNYMPYAATRVITATAAPTTTINLVCEVFNGAATIRDVHLNALYVGTP